MKNIRNQENYVIVDTVYADSFSLEIYYERELCIENPNSEDFRIIYAKDTGDKSTS